VLDFYSISLLLRILAHCLLLYKVVCRFLIRRLMSSAVGLVVYGDSRVTR